MFNKKTWLLLETRKTRTTFRPVLLQSHFSSFPFSLSRSSHPQTPTPICMFYFSHPFGISTPSSTNNADNVGSEKPPKKGSKYTTTTYLVTEIQKNNSDESQDEGQTRKHPYTDRELIPWPKNFLLPPLIQLLEKKHGNWLFSLISSAHENFCSNVSRHHAKVSFKRNNVNRENVKSLHMKNFPRGCWKTSWKVKRERKFLFKCLPNRHSWLWVSHSKALFFHANTFRVIVYRHRQINFRSVER